ncbi:hypothetical protein ACTVPS_01700 [Serratia marcescens]|uniref:hypothetical protein n=1 Tax=Serratia marcescens TaxID=615 RepID=UPI003FA775D5
MSTEKLSELSKPVGFAREEDIKLMQSGKLLSGLTIWRSGKEPLYSQEYVSALLAELEAKDERICELEAIATEYAGKFQKAQDANKHLVIMSNDDKKRIAELEAGHQEAAKQIASWRRIAKQNIEEREKDLAALDAERQKIIGMEAIRADASQVFKEIGNELGCNPDNESIMMAIDDLKKDNTSLRDQRAGLVQAVSELGAKLATPVRLPNKNDDEFWFDGVFQVAKFDRAVERAVSAAGFKFVGDE